MPQDELTYVERDFKAFVDGSRFFSRHLDDFIRRELAWLDENFIGKRALWNRLIAMRAFAALRGQAAMYDNIRTKFRAKHLIAAHDTRMAALEAGFTARVLA